MKIGVVSSWRDTLALFQFLSHHNHEYLIYCDQQWFPFEEKSLDTVINRIIKAVDFLKSKWVDTIILDPIYELELKYSGDKKVNDVIMPLFQRYLQHAFKYSLVGKIWILTDFWSYLQTQNLVEREEKFHNLTEEQKSVKKFSYPFHYWVKMASSWTANINDLWVHNPYLIRSMKNDLRYFKDAYVDTVLPMHYHYFRMQRTIKSFFNFSKIRFHDLSVVEHEFTWLVEQINKWNEWTYSVSIWINQPSEFITRDKQLMWLLQRGKSEKVKFEEI